MPPSFKISIDAPTNPNKIPKLFLKVMDSLIIKKESKITKIGLIVITIAAFIGVVKFNPSKNKSWLIATPKIPQTAKRKISFFSTFSCAKNKYERENKINAPITRNKTKADGKIKSGITSFAKL